MLPDQNYRTDNPADDSSQAQLELQESRDQLAFAIEAAQLGTWDYDPHTNKFSANDRLKKWFGLPPGEQIELGHAMDVIAEKDRQRVAEAIQKALDFSSGGIYDVEYAITNPATKKEMEVRAKGRAWFNEERIAYRFNGIMEDVTGQKIANRKTLQIEQTIRNMVLEAPIGICVMDAPSLISEIVNDSFIEVAGKPYDAIAGKFYWDAFAEARPYYEAALKTVVEEGIPFYANEVELMLIRNGKEENIFVTFVYSPLKDAEGKVSKVAVWVLENTQQVVARQKIQKSTDKLNIVIAASELGTYELNLKTDMVECSERFHQIFGYVNGEILSHPEFINHLHPDDLLIRNEAFKKAIDGGILHYQSRVICKDKSIKWIEVRGQVFYDEEHKPSVLIGTCRDFTEEKTRQKELEESEQKFRLLADSMPQFIWTGDGEGNLNYFNQSVYNYSGLTPEQIQRDGWLQIVHPDEREENTKKWMHSIQTGQDFIFEHRFRRNDGQYRWQLSRATPQKDAHGNIQMWVGTSTDIQDQKTFARELEKQVSERTRQLEQKNKELEKMNVELQSFAYVSSHDLQEPLRKIQTFTSFILEKEYQALSGKGKEYFNRIQGSAKRMQNLIEDLITYSRTGSSERILEKTNLNEILDEVKNDLKEVIAEKKAIIEAGELCTINIIPFQFRQLLNNLVGNSLKFSKPGVQPVIKIKAEIADSDTVKDESLSPGKKYCHITIADNGIGFDPEYKNRIFEVFQRLHIKEEYTGTGIGLSIVKRIVENHNGIIRATGVVNEGATFDIYIPE